MTSEQANGWLERNDRVHAIIALIGCITQPELAYILGISDGEAKKILHAISDRLVVDGQRNGWNLWKIRE